MSENVLIIETVLMHSAYGYIAAESWRCGPGLADSYFPSSCSPTCLTK